MTLELSHDNHRLPDDATLRPGRLHGARIADEAAIEAVELQLSLLWRRGRSMSHHLSRSVHPDMEPAAYGLLTYLAQEGAMRLTELAASIGVGKPSVSRQIAFLESSDWSARRPIPSMAARRPSC